MRRVALSQNISRVKSRGNSNEKGCIVAEYLSCEKGGGVPVMRRVALWRLINISGVKMGHK